MSYGVPTIPGVTPAITGIFMWYEIYPQEPSIPISNVTANAGDDVQVYVSYDPDLNQGYFLLCTPTVCGEGTQDVSGSSVADWAEWIVERPTTTELTALSPFGNLRLTNVGGSEIENGGAFVDGFNLDDGTINTATYLDSETMKSCGGTTLAHPNSLTTGAFTDSFDSSGVSESC